MAGWGLMEARTIVEVQVAFNLNPAATTRTRLNYQPCLQRRVFSGCPGHSNRLYCLLTCGSDINGRSML